jgi:hypothetical protein
MDLRLYGRVLWRFRVIVLVGFVLAVLLTVLSVARVSFAGGPKLSYRQEETWQATSRIFVTQNGFPLLRSIYTKVLPVGKQSNGQTNYVSVLNDPSRFASYATLYADIATSDPVRELMQKDGPVRGSIDANPVLTNIVGTPLPLVDLQGLAPNKQDAMDTAQRATRALQTYIKRQQDALGLPANQRVVLSVLNAPTSAALVGARSKTRPVVVFLAAMLAVIGLVFVLENLKPRLRKVEPVVDDKTTDDHVRRSA